MKKQVTFALFSLIATLLITSCSSTKYRTEVTRFHQLPISGSGETFNILTPNKTPSLENQQHLGRLAQGLIKYGWKQSNSKDAKYKVAVDYGITEGKTVQGVQQIYGKTGGGTTTYHTGTASAYGNYGGYSSGNYSGTSYTPATYGIVGAVPYNYTAYGRYLFIFIKDQGGNVVLEGKCTSTGTSANLSAVVPRMIDSFLSDFPGDSGKTKTYLKN